MDKVRFAADGLLAADVESLWDWLQNEPVLRGRLGRETSAGTSGTMGAAASDIVVQVAATVAGASAIWAALAHSVSVWLTQRRSDVTLKLSTSDGRTILLDARRVADPERLLRTLLEAESSETA